MKLTVKKLIPIIVVLALLFIVVYYQAFLGPILKKTGLTIRERSSLKETVTTLQNLSKDLSDVTNDRIQLENAVLEKTQNLPEKLDSYDMVHLLSTAKANRLTRHSLLFLESITREDYEIHPVRFSFTTDYKGLLRFLTEMESLSTKPTISNMQLSSGGVGSNFGSEGEISVHSGYDLAVEMTLNFYVKGNREEE